MRDYSPIDCLIEAADQALKVIVGPASSTRELPGREFTDDALSEADKACSARLMRINHAGEVAAQGLYHGQALTARAKTTAERMRKNAHEESDHLAWCAQRLDQLGGRASLLTPLWYAGSFTIGAAAGLAGDRWSLGFVRETENQVVAHLDSHLAKAPMRDRATRTIIEQIKRDEAGHADVAGHAGAHELPRLARSLMRMTAKVMTTTTYYL